MRDWPWRCWLEVVATTLVVLVIVALGLPAVQSAREAARRTQWRNTLKLVGLALHNYHDTFQQFPPGGIFTSDGMPMHGWPTAIHCFLESSPWYNSVDFNIPWDDPLQFEHFTVFHRANYSPIGDPSVVIEARDDGLVNVHASANGWLMHRNYGVSLSQLSSGAASQTILVADANGHYLPYGHPENWRDPTIPFQTSPDEFGHPSRELTHVLYVDGHVDVVGATVAPGVMQALAGPPELRPTNAQTKRAPWPYQPPPGGYWKTEQFASVGENFRFGIQLRRDPEGVVRRAQWYVFDRGSREDWEAAKRNSPLDRFLPELARKTTLQDIHLPEYLSDTGLLALQRLPELRRLTIGGSQVTDATLPQLANYPALEEVTFQHARITQTGLPGFKPGPRLKRLNLDLGDHHDCTPAGLLALIEAHPTLKLTVQTTGTSRQGHWYHFRWTEPSLRTLVERGLDFSDPERFKEFRCTP